MCYLPEAEKVVSFTPPRGTTTSIAPDRHRGYRGALRVLARNTTPLRSAFQKEVETNIEFGEAVLTILRRKAECQLELIAPAHDEQVVEFWRSLLDMQTVQAKLGRERHRLTVVQGDPRSTFSGRLEE